MLIAFRRSNPNGNAEKPHTRQELRRFVVAIGRGRTESPGSLAKNRECGSLQAVTPKRLSTPCQRAKLAHWHPNQLRHSAATAIRKEFGIEAASVILGHSDIGVTQVYAESDKAKAIEVARRIG